jgi:hypothetical protein
MGNWGPGRGGHLKLLEGAHTEATEAKNTHTSQSEGCRSASHTERGDCHRTFVCCLLSVAKSFVCIIAATALWGQFPGCVRACVLARHRIRSHHKGLLRQDHPYIRVVLRETYKVHGQSPRLRIGCALPIEKSAVTIVLHCVSFSTALRTRSWHNCLFISAASPRPRL